MTETQSNHSKNGKTEEEKLEEELDIADGLLKGIDEQTWMDVKYTCRECENSWMTLDYLKEIHRKVDSDNWNWENWKRTQKTVIFNFNRVRAYPNDFTPIEQFCPVCNQDMKVERESLKGNLYVEKIEKDEEPGDYVKQVSDIAPHGWKNVSTR